VVLIGLLVFLLTANPKYSRLGELAFFAGLLAFLLRVSDSMVSLVK
jgi:hypothetical protein